MRVNDAIHFCPPARVVFSCGSRSQLPALLQRLGYKHGVLVTDTFFTGQTPWVDEYITAARSCGIETTVYEGGMPDPSTILCDDATRTLRAQMTAVPDHVIALGGGSNIDLAKALCLTLVEGAPIKNVVGTLEQAPRCLPLIAMPTTSGTGSEATPGAILVDPENATKVAVMDNQLRPIIALIDPEFTYSCPPKVTADAGIDALTHAIESYLTLDSSDFQRNGNPDPGYSGRSSLTMMFAREAICLCARYLLRAYRDGSDTEARIGMAYASHYAALSYGSSGLNAIHGIAYAVAGITHQSHGSTNAVTMPYVLDELVDIRHRELLDIARIFGIMDADERAAVAKLPRLIREIVGGLGIPTTFAEFGLKEEQLPGLVQDALEVKRLADAFPMPDAASAYQRIITRAFHGQMLEGRASA